MSIRTLSLTLNLDTGTFTTNARSATGVMKELSRAIDETSRYARANASALDGSIRSLRSYVENGLRLKQTQEQVRSSQDQFVKGLLREIDTMGLNSRQLRDYTAMQLGLTEQTRELRAALDEKASAFARETAAQERAAEATRIYAQAARDLAAAEEARLEAGHALLKELMDEITVLKSGTEALRAEQAATLGVATDYEKLIAIKRQLIAETAEGEAVVRSMAEAEREEATATRESTTATHGKARAIYELNVLSHELASGRIRQAISSFSILLNNIGLAAQATLGLTLSIGILYGMSKPIEEAAKHMEELKNQSRELGVSIGFLQTLGVASDMLGIKTDKIVQGMGRLDQSFQRARSGSKQAKDGYDALGVSLNKNYTQQELLTQVLKGWDKLPDGPRKVAVATELFGREGKNLIPVLDQLAENFDKINGLTDKYGLNNARAVAIGSQLAEQFNETALAAKGLGMQLLVTVGPALLDFLKGVARFSEATREFLTDSDRIDQALRVLKAALIGLATVMLVNTLPGLYALIGAVPRLIQVFENFIVITRATVAEIGILDALMLATPWGLLAAGVGLLAGGLYYLATRTHEQTAAQKDLNRVQKEAAELQDKLITLTDKEREALRLKIQKDLEAKQAALQKAQADLAAAQASVTRQMAENGKLAAMSAGDGKLFTLGGLKTDTSARDKAKADVDAFSASIAALKKEIADIDGFKPPKIGTTAGDGAAGGSHKKADKVAETVADLTGELGRLEGQIDDTGSTWGKYNALINDTNSALGKALKGHEDLKAKILELAHQVDATQGYAALKKAYDDQHAKYLEAKKDLADQVAGLDAVTRARQRAHAAIDEQTKKAVDYKPRHGETSATDLGEATKDEGDRTQEIQDAGKTLSEWEKKAKDAKAAADELWTAYSAGVVKADAETAKLKAEFDRALADLKDPAQKVVLQKWGDQFFAGRADSKGAEAATDFREKTKKINAELAGDTLQRQREIVDGEIQAAYERIAAMDMTKDEGKKAYADYVAYVEALNRKANAETPWGKMAQEWGDMTGNMQKASAQWMNSFVSDLSKGKLNFSDFAKSVIQDLAQIVIKALMAQYIIKPLLAAFGVNESAGGGPTFGGGANADGTTSLMSNVANAFMSALGGGGDTPIFHGGGIVGGAAMRRSIDPSVFANAMKYHTGGIAGLRPDEVPAILQRGEGVFTHQQMKDMARSGHSAQAPVQINLNNQSGVPLDADHSGTKFDGEKYILDVVVTHLQKPGALRNAVKSNQ